MASLSEIKHPISSELKEFDHHFKEAMRSSTPLLDKVTRYLIKRKGKQIRPILVFLSAGICGGFDNKTYRAATLVELLHTASLVHDDVVDESNMRRGFFSINALWKNKVAVLVGDYLLSQGLLLSVENNDHDLLKIVSDAVREMSEGELLQIEKARKLDIEEEIYFEIIRKKTASLIASCCACGAASVSASEEQIKKMRSFGEALGLAFQIKDDIFDYQPNNKTGKPSGLDIKEKKITLPLIYLLKNSSSADNRRIRKIVKRHGENHKKVNSLLQEVRSNGGLEYAEKKMIEFRDKALDILDSFPESEFRNSMKELVYFTIERKH